MCGDRENLPENHNGHCVTVYVSYPENQTAQGGNIFIEEWFDLQEVKEGEDYPDGNVIFTREDEPSLWRIVDEWKKGLVG